MVRCRPIPELQLNHLPRQEAVFIYICDAKADHSGHERLSARALQPEKRRKLFRTHVAVPGFLTHLMSMTPAAR